MRVLGAVKNTKKHDGLLHVPYVGTVGRGPVRREHVDGAADVDERAVRRGAHNVGSGSG